MGISPCGSSTWHHTYPFTQDYGFSSPSTAAVVLARSANGRLEWKAADERTLTEIQETEAAL